jgi:hypothetical protein
MGMSFQSPNYTMTPNDLFDDLLKEISEMSELKVTLAAVRHTFGYHRGEAEMSVTWFEQVTGMARGSVKRGIDLAIKRGTIRVVKKHTITTSTVYAVNVADGVRGLAEGGSTADPGGSTAGGLAADPIKESPSHTHTQDDKQLQKPEPTQPTPRESAWKELAEVFPMTNGVAWQKFDELWQKFPDPRRHTYAIERARKANPAKLQFYLEDFCSYDPDKPKTWGEGTRPAPSPRYSRNAAPAPNYRTRTD